MRISTNLIYEAGTRQMNTLQTSLARTQEQLATNRRMLSAADDPIASARALELTQSQSINTQFATNRQNARATLSELELALGNAGSVLDDVQTSLVTIGNGAYNATDRATYATELEGKLSDLLAVANSTDGTGGYLFSGFKSSVVPFTQTGTGAIYNGDQGQLKLQVASARQLPINATGSAVFENLTTGNGTFATAAAATNTGTGVVSAGLVSNAALVTGHNYTLTFALTGSPAVPTYTIQDATAGTAVPPPPAVAAPIAYQSGNPITFDGLTFDIKGVPANGDTFTVAPSTKQSVFATMQNVINALRAPMPTTAGGKAAFTAMLADTGAILGAATDKVLTARTTVGSNQKELDYLDSTGDDLAIQYASSLGTMQDLDVAKAISEFTQQKTNLEAAQQSFKALSSLSLFNYI